MKNVLNEESQQLIQSVLTVVKLAVTHPHYSPSEDGNAVENVINVALAALEKTTQ